MSALLEYECQVPVDGYEIITIEIDEPEPDPEDDDPPTVVVFGKERILQPRSERTRRFDLFKHGSSVFLEFAQTPATPEGIREFADRYGLLWPDYSGGKCFSNGERVKSFVSGSRSIFTWRSIIEEMRRTVELWNKAMMIGNFSKIIRAVQKRESLLDPTSLVFGGAAEFKLLLKEDPLSGGARLCLRPGNLLHALWAQFILAIDGNANLSACVQCRKWFTIEAGRGRSDKAYCSNACRMRAYRKRKSSG
jgi:hypothetical protein